MPDTRLAVHAIRAFTIFCLLFFFPAVSSAQQQQQPAADATGAPDASSSTGDGWSSYGGDPGGSRYSRASQISRENVAQLKVAWTFHTGALQQKTNLIRKAAFEATPILVDDKLFLTTPYDQVFALNP